MNRTIRAILGVVFILVITFCVISICQNVFTSAKIDVTDQGLYTLSDGTRAILGKLNQPIKVKLYYARTAALKGPDQIRYFNNYYQFVHEVLAEYEAMSNGMIELEVIDPRPYSDDEADALRYGLKRFSITQEENFFFGLVVQTQFGVEKTIEFFAPQRQNFIEYDITYLIDTAITRQKTKIGILSSMEVMGDTLYMSRMKQMQNQKPAKPWGIVEQLKQQYDVSTISSDVEKIEGVDVLLVIHPKDMSEKTLFAIDQFVLKGGRTIVCVDPFSVWDLQQQPPAGMQGTLPQVTSNLDVLMKSWGVEMPENTFAGDRELAAQIPDRQGRILKIIGQVALKPGQCLSKDSVITAELNNVILMYSGVLQKIQADDQGEFEMKPLLTTTAKGNSWRVDNQYELMGDPSQLIEKFFDGDKPVVMGYQITGKFKSAFPEGIDVELDAIDGEEGQSEKETIKRTGLTEAADKCVVTIFADVDFITDFMAYRELGLGLRTVVGDNSALMMNAIDDMRGSTDLIGIRSRGSFQRPFAVVDDIEKQAAEDTAQEEERINAEIQQFQSDLQTLLDSSQTGREEVVGSSILKKKQEVELRIRQRQRELIDVKKRRREEIESLGNKLRAFNMVLAPAFIFVVAVVIGIFRTARKRHYISHASDS